MSANSQVAYTANSAIEILALMPHGMDTKSSSSVGSNVANLVVADCCGFLSGMMVWAVHPRATAISK